MVCCLSICFRLLSYFAIQMVRYDVIRLIALATSVVSVMRWSGVCLSVHLSVPSMGRAASFFTNVNRARGAY